jgi:hypothetical protein
MNLISIKKWMRAQLQFDKIGKWCFLFIYLFIVGINLTKASTFIDTTRMRVKAKKTVVLNNAPITVSAKKCPDIDVIYTVIEDAINVGAPTYNAGNIMGCYRIYEGAAYKILYKYGDKCKEVKNILEAALEKSYGDYSASEKAWIMRMAFDSILGQPTTTTK